VRPLPGMDSAALARRVEEAVRRAATPLADADVEVEVLSDSPPLLLDAAAAVHCALCELTGSAEGVSVSFATDAGWLQRLGLDCAIFGPGSIEVAHKPNEHLPKAELAAARGVIEAMIHRFCVEGA
jgi:acetylornithine deacetylase